jgi:hypothetical protein
MEQKVDFKFVLIVQFNLHQNRYTFYLNDKKGYKKPVSSYFTSNSDVNFRDIYQFWLLLNPFLGISTHCQLVV